jgi:hypothetical protein
MVSKIFALIFLICSAAHGQRYIEGDILRSSNRAKFWTPPGVSDTLVGVSATQSVSGKTVLSSDIDGGTASNTSRITVPKAAKASLDSLTRKEATVVYGTDTGKLYVDNGTILNPVGSGNGGKNYIAGGDAESGLTGFSTYADAAGTSPVDGTGGSPSVTWTISSSSPLESSNSFLLTKGATNRQGDGAGYAFSIDAQDKAKVLQVSFNYLVASGTFTAGTPSTASDVTVWIYDVTNGVVIQPSSYKLLSNSTTLADTFNATFQTASNSTSYRLIFHVGSTSSSAYILKIDDIKVTPSTYVYGTPVTDWKSSTCTSSWVANTTTTCQYRQVGGNMEIQFKNALTGAPTSASLTFTLPGGFTIDTAKLVDANQYRKSLGTAVGYDSSATASLVLVPVLNSSTSIALTYDTSTTTAALGLVTQAAPMTWATGDSVEAIVSLPIAGWSSSVQMSDQTDSRPVGFKVGKDTSQTIPTGTWTQWTSFGTPSFDTHSSFNTTTGIYTIPVSGYYRVFAQLTWATNASGARNIQINRNGESLSTPRIATTSTANVAGLETTCTAGSTDWYNAGDTIRVYALQTSGGNLGTSTSGGYNVFSAEKVSGPNQIAASASINLRYFNTAGTSVANTGDTKIPFVTKDFDNTGSFVTDTFTCPISGKYRVSATVQYQSALYAVANNAYLTLYKNGVAGVFGAGVSAHAAVTVPIGTFLNTIIQCNAGDTLDVRATNSRSAGATLLNTAAGANHIEIERTGN